MTLETKKLVLIDLLKTSENPQAQIQNRDFLSSNAVQKIHLPKLQLPIFYGDPLKWVEFYDSFESSVHSQNIPDVQKFNYLLSTLRGSAHKALEGISVTNSNYLEALGILKKRYGDQNVIKRYLYSELRNIPPSSPKTPDLRRTLESIDRICRQLSFLGENLEQQNLTMLILEKLPQNILIELGKMKKLACRVLARSAK